MTSPSPHPQLMRLASDHLPIYEDARRWFLEQGPAIASLLVAGLDDARLGSVAHWRLLLLLRDLALPATLPAIVTALDRALERHDPIVMPGALQALAAFDTADTSAVWSTVLRSAEIEDIEHAVTLLGTLADDRAVALLGGLLAHERPRIRRRVVRALAGVASEAAREALRRHRLHETDRDVLAEMDASR